MPSFINTSNMLIYAYIDILSWATIVDRNGTLNSEIIKDIMEQCRTH